jgi:hypothetical protein
MTEKDYEFYRTNFIKTICRFLYFGIEKKLVRIFDEAIEHFSAEQDTEEVAYQTQSSRDWRQP